MQTVFVTVQKNHSYFELSELLWRDLHGTWKRTKESKSIWKMSFPHLPEISRYFYLHKFWIQAANQPPTLFCQSSHMHMYDRKQSHMILFPGAHTHTPHRCTLCKCAPEEGTLGWKEPGKQGGYWQNLCRRREAEEKMAGWSEAKRSLAVVTAAKYRAVAFKQIKAVAGWNVQ